MATYSSHRLIMGKVEIDSFCCLTGDIEKKISTDMLSDLDKSCMKHGGLKHGGLLT